MGRWLVTFRSRHAGTADVTCADVRARSPLAAIRMALRHDGGLGHEWVDARAVLWPERLTDVGEALQEISGGRAAAAP